MGLHQDVLDMLKKTSRTFFIPISHLPSGLQEAVSSAYLCMRAIDEIEDHPTLEKHGKMRYLRSISSLLQAQTSVATFAHSGFSTTYNKQQDTLPEVTLRISEWACYAPEQIAPRIWDATAAMAERMANWVANGWKIRTESDLDSYTFAVAGAIGLLLCDIWAWFDGVQMNRTPAIHFGRGLQAVNILRNRTEDLARGVDFFPTGWSREHMQQYAMHNLSQADIYSRSLPPGPFVFFIQTPLALAYATLEALARGESKLSRSAVLQLTQQIKDD
ncbi:MAG: phytoene/squalene synthase family protein [Chloroflexi bacterium]|nr:MAG: phytoene/squalene synthase family protein [Chloroflexota bacterium]TMC44818.1 MAG: phytoene/squalene synthase family protein [Chloroflexota bacterium]TMD01968.1 MAG: phytoene/squalene synthase family protein [Chloroflexota bacterium]